ncbi:MAG TPA: ABC transporter substrate-binding protein [Gaiellaceae bacterium]|nr:ABC transporter substrate-binding protein [Gaiellaceae bacterium]
MKRLLPLLGIAALVAALAACGSSNKTPTTTSSNGSPPTKTPGKLVVGFDLPATSFWNGQASGHTILHPSGFEYGLALDVAKQLGISQKNVSFLRAPFATILLAGSKPYDFAMEETTITAERAKVVGFSAPYFDANQGVLIAKGVTKPTSIADLKSLQTCAQAATTGLDWIKHKLRPSKQPLVYSASSNAAFNAVQSGSCQALILDVPIIEAQNQKQPGAFGGVVGQIDTHEGYGAVFQKNSALIPYVSKAIRTLQANGTISKLTKRWFGFDPAKVPVLK